MKTNYEKRFLKLIKKENEKGSLQIAILFFGKGVNLFLTKNSTPTYCQS